MVSYLVHIATVFATVIGASFNTVAGAASLLHGFFLTQVITDHFRDIVFYLSIITVTIILISLVFVTIAFRRPIKVNSMQRKNHLGADVAWTIIPLLMLFVLLIPIVNMFFYDRQDQPQMVVALLLHASKLQAE